MASSLCISKSIKNVFVFDLMRKNSRNAVVIYASEAYFLCSMHEKCTFWQWVAILDDMEILTTCWLGRSSIAEYETFQHTCANENKHEIKVKHYEMKLRTNVQATFE